MKTKSQNPKTILQNANKSAEIVARIDDMLTQILVKVPIKPLIRCKLVSKHWLSLINSHEFCIMRNPSPNPTQGFFFGHHSYGRQYQYQYIPLYPKNSLVPPSINMDFTSAPSNTIILNSCNGLLLCCSSKTWNHINTVLFKPDCTFYVFNSTTKISTALPHLPIYDHDHKVATLVFDPVKSPHYKVVLVMTNSPSYEIKIYSSETGSWSDGGEIGINMRVDVFVSGVYWNGSVHWLNTDLSANDNGKMSLRFHVDTQVLHEMASPPVVQHKNYRKNNYHPGESCVTLVTRDINSWKSYYFGESCNHLHFVELVVPRFNIYEMKMDYSEWFVKYRVDLSLFIADYPEAIKYRFRHHNYYLIYVLSLIRGENDKDSNLVLRIRRKAIKFNLVDGTSEKLCDFAHDMITCAVTESLTGGSVESVESSYMFSNEYGLDYIQSLYSC